MPAKSSSNNVSGDFYSDELAVFCVSVLVAAVAGASSQRDDGVMLVVVLSTCIAAVLLLVAAILLSLCAYLRRLRSQRLQNHQGTLIDLSTAA